MGFVTITAKEREIMSHANLNSEYYFLLQKEPLKTDIKLDHLMVIESNGELKTKCEYFGEKSPKFSKQVWTLGEARGLQSSLSVC